MRTRRPDATADAALPPAVRAEGGWLTAVRGAVVLMLLCGAAYPLLAVWVGEALFPYRARGSLIEHGGRVVGSELVGQPFSGPRWFHGRPSAAGSGYDAFALSGSNQAPGSPALRERARLASRAITEAEGIAARAIPPDLIAASGSGVDPHLSPAAALLQVPRVAAARGLPPAQVRELVEAAVERPTLGVLGQARVNVLMLNLVLERGASPAGSP